MPHFHCSFVKFYPSVKEAVLTGNCFNSFSHRLGNGSLYFNYLYERKLFKCQQALIAYFVYPWLPGLLTQDELL